MTWLSTFYLNLLLMTTAMYGVMYLFSVLLQLLKKKVDFQFELSIHYLVLVGVLLANISLPFLPEESFQKPVEAVFDGKLPTALPSSLDQNTISQTSFLTNGLPTWHEFSHSLGVYLGLFFVGLIMFQVLAASVCLRNLQLGTYL